MIDPKDYKFAVEFDGKCPIKDTCIFKSYNCPFHSDCPLPIIKNPLCGVTDFRNCRRRFLIRKLNGKFYILYNCRGCPYLLKQPSKVIKAIGKSEHLIFGKELINLINAINEQEKHNNKDGESSNDKVIDFISTYLASHHHSVEPVSNATQSSGSRVTVNMSYSSNSSE